MFALRVVALVENGVLGQSLREIVIGAEGIRDLAVTDRPEC